MKLRDIYWSRITCQRNLKSIRELANLDPSSIDSSLSFDSVDTLPLKEIGLKPRENRTKVKRVSEDDFKQGVSFGILGPIFSPAILLKTIIHFHEGGSDLEVDMVTFFFVLHTKPLLSYPLCIDRTFYRAKRIRWGLCRGSLHNEVSEH